jgi:hypothetical protein
MKTLLAKLLGISTNLLNFFIPIFRQVLAQGVENLLPIALGIVMQLAKGELSSEDKKRVAVDMLQKAAIKEGITASASLINWTVESAVQQLKATK